MTFRLNLPCKANELESFIHCCCDTNGFDNCTVTADGNGLRFSYSDAIGHSEPTTENMKWKC